MLDPDRLEAVIPQTEPFQLIPGKSRWLRLNANTSYGQRSIALYLRFDRKRGHKVAESGPEETLCIKSELDGRAEFQVFDYGMANEDRKVEWKRTRKQIFRLMLGDISRVYYPAPVVTAEYAHVVTLPAMDSAQIGSLKNHATRLTKLRYELLESANREDMTFRKTVVAVHLAEWKRLVASVRRIENGERMAAAAQILSDKSLGLTHQEQLLLAFRIDHDPLGDGTDKMLFNGVYNLLTCSQSDKRQTRTLEGLLAGDGFSRCKRILVRVRNRYPRVSASYVSEVNTFLCRDQEATEEEHIPRRGGMMTGDHGKAAKELLQKIRMPLETARLFIANIHRRNLNSL